MGPSREPARPVAGLLVALTVLGAFAFLVWRASLPNNRQQAGWNFSVVRTDGQPYYVPRVLNYYEDAVTLVTAHHFARDGFLRTHLLPNRARHPLVSLYDPGRTRCEWRAEPEHVLTYWNMYGQQVPAYSLNHDCIYVHYPPLADWIYGALAVVGLDRVLHYKLLAILVNCAWLLLAYRWLRRETSRAGAAVAVALMATLPAFLEWGDTLYFYSFQFLLCFAALLAWRRYLDGGGGRWFAVTWACFFAEALASYQLTLFLAVMLAVLLVREHGLRPTIFSRSLVGRLLLQGTAPVAAFALHLALIASYLGWGPALLNMRNTLVARVTHGEPFGAMGYWHCVGLYLFPVLGIPVAIAAIVTVRVAAGVSWRRELMLLVGTFVGGLTFFAAFPGTTTEHPWMMYRHLIPFVLLVLALVADTVGLAVTVVSSGLRRRRGWLAVLGGVAAVVLLGLGARTGFAHVRGELAWNRLRNADPNPGNLVRRALEVLYWNEGRPRSDASVFAPVSGIPNGEPPGWQTDFSFVGPAPGNYEVWWLDDVAVRRTRLLLDQSQVEEAGARCRIATFDGRDFVDWSAETARHVVPVQGAAQPPPESLPRAWLELTLPREVSTRALRLTCAPSGRLPLRQIEAYGGGL